jgi:hypothetical protein
MDTMTEDSIKQVMIKGRAVGLVGLDETIEKTKIACKHKSDSEISDFLINAVSEKNYIPSSARDAYSRALLREYQIAMNLPSDPVPSAGLNILVLGMGCARCDQLQADLRDVLSEMNIAADLRHVTDVREISRFSVLGAPALVINDKVVAVGDVPPKSLIRKWITEAYTSPKSS